MSTKRREYLLTRVSDDCTQIEIRQGFNWTTYGIRPFSVGALESNGPGVVRLVQLDGDQPKDVVIGNRYFEVVAI